MLSKEATIICKTILRNGYDAYIINGLLQEEIYQITNVRAIDIATEADFEILSKLFPHLEKRDEENLLAYLATDEGTAVRFYAIELNECAHPDFGFVRLSPHMMEVLQETSQHKYNAIKGFLDATDPELAFEEQSTGQVKLKGVPFKTLQRNQRLAITALRMSANYNLPIETSTWLAILRSAHYILEYVPNKVFMDEMRLVAAENLWRFVELLNESFILHAFLPEVAALHALKQQRNKHDESEVSVFEYTIDCMRFYPEESLHYDWVGAVALLFHAVGKLYTADKYHGHWTFYQYHRVGAQRTRSILRRLHMESDESELICNLIRDHIRFQSMLTDRGIRRFESLPETERLIEMTRAHIKATGSSYTNFNHNLKYLERAGTPERMLKPLLSGNEIMDVTGLPQGKSVGIIREALLKAQIAGEVVDSESAINFVRSYEIKE